MHPKKVLTEKLFSVPTKILFFGHNIFLEHFVTKEIYIVEISEKFLIGRVKDIEKRLFII
jgi:hypothetical protein